MKVTLTDTVRFGLKLDKLTYLMEPEWKNREMVSTSTQRKEYLSLPYLTQGGSEDADYTNTDFRFVLGGDVTFGLGATSETGIDLSDLIGAFVENLLLSIGITDDMSLKLSYEVAANINIIDLDAIQLRLNIINKNSGQSILTAYYMGTEDALYLDLERLGNLGISSIGKLPRLKYEGLGLSDMLGSVDIVGMLGGLFGTSSAANGNVIQLNAADPDFVYNAFSALNRTVLGAGYLMSLSSRDGELNFFNPSYAYNADGDDASGDAGGIDILGLIGAALDKIYIDQAAGTMSVIIASDVLTTLWSPC